MSRVSDRQAMRRAISLAWQGWGRVSPNPLVGAVVVSGGTIRGEGWHPEYGGKHAERIALEQAGTDAAGASLFTTLEPCRHQGQQPPCVPAIIEAGISRVIVAAGDPNPIASGGAAELRQAGIEVEQGLLEEEALRQNAVFLSRFALEDRPFVALKLATSIDSRIADQAGRSQWISGPEAREFVHWLRAGHDAVAVGGATARADNPSLTVRGQVEPRVPPVRVVFSSSGELPQGSALSETADQLATIVFSREGAEQLERPRQPGLRRVAAQSPAEALAKLKRAGIESVLVEGGGRLAGYLVHHRLVDRFYWIQSPLWLGESGVPAFGAFGVNGLSSAPRWQVVERRALGQDSLLVLEPD